MVIETYECLHLRALEITLRKQALDLVLLLTEMGEEIDISKHSIRDASCQMQNCLIVARKSQRWEGVQYLVCVHCSVCSLLLELLRYPELPHLNKASAFAIFEPWNALAIFEPMNMRR